MKLKWKKSGKGDDEFDKPLITFQKPFKCACYCFCRPEMTAHNHNEDKQIGKVYDDFRCFDPSFQVSDEENKKKYKISGSCCQCGLLCKSYSPFYETKFFIYEADAPEDPNNAVGSIVKKERECFKALFTDADEFDIYFPKNATAYDKLMLIGTTLMIDYSYFEEDNANQNGGGVQDGYF